MYNAVFEILECILELLVEIQGTFEGLRYGENSARVDSFSRHRYLSLNMPRP